ncbi:hypothetical protein [Nocardiopsis sp. CNT312]|uniref:hypothetical protein n=1 Tax=Nocardiopsis sp. CNT312 TaxID=1137268 RepID=UPI00048EF58A|nr:hypothetical protein [Nocardiopsis sp. CNT312]
MNTLPTSAVVLAGTVDLDTDTVTPGVLGFLAIFAVGLALYYLMRNMTGKLRALNADTEREGAGPAAASSEEESRS